MNDIATYTQLQEISNSLSPSKLHQHRNPADAYFAVMIGQDLGLSPAASLQNIYNVNGMPALKADMKLALVKRHPEYAGCEIEGDHLSCTVTLYRKNGTDKPDKVVSKFTIQDAERAKLVGKDNWKAYPQRMLKARALSYACNDLFPDAMIGLMSHEEAMDIAKPISLESPKKKAKDAPVVPEYEVMQDVDIDPVIESDTEPEPASDDIHELKLSICNVIQSLIDGKIDGFESEIRRHNSFNDHLFTDSVGECGNYELLVAYHDHLAAKLRGESKPTIKQRQDMLWPRLINSGAMAEEISEWGETLQNAKRHADVDTVEAWLNERFPEVAK